MSFDLSKKSSRFAPGRPERCFEPCIGCLLAVGLARLVKGYSTDLFALAGGEAVTTCGVTGVRPGTIGGQILLRGQTL